MGTRGALEDSGILYISYRDKSARHGRPLALGRFALFDPRVEHLGYKAQVRQPIHHRRVGDIKGFHHVTLPFTQYQR